VNYVRLPLSVVPLELALTYYMIRPQGTAIIIVVVIVIERRTPTTQVIWDTGRKACIGL
jgi:hypothetical protein